MRGDFNNHLSLLYCPSGENKAVVLTANSYHNTELKPKSTSWARDGRKFVGVVNKHIVKCLLLKYIQASVFYSFYLWV